MYLAIPELVALKSLIRINDVFERKFIEATEGIKYKRHEIEQPKPLIEFALINKRDPDKPCTHQDLLPKGHVYEEKLRLANMEDEIMIKMDDNSIPELDKYGRFFIWPNYIPETMHDEVCEMSKLLRTINHSVVQDLQDYIIVQGF